MFSEFSVVNYYFNYLLPYLEKPNLIFFTSSRKQTKTNQKNKGLLTVVSVKAFAVVSVFQ